MPEESDLSLLSSKFSKISLSETHLVSSPKKNIVSLAEFENADYSEMINKLNEIVFKIFKKGAMEAGYTFATLHYTFLNKSGAEKEVGLSILNKLLVTYFQTFNSPYVYSVFIHSYILRWFRLIVILDTKTHELMEFMHFNDEEWRKSYLRIYKFIDHPFDVLPSINPDNPIIPFISIEDQVMIEDLVKSNVNQPEEIGKNFAKFYHINLVRILKELETLKYSFELQSMIGPRLLIDLNKQQITNVIEGIAEFYFSMNIQFKEIIKNFDKELKNQQIHFMRKKWLGEKTFSGILFSSVVKKRLAKN